MDIYFKCSGLSRNFLIIVLMIAGIALSFWLIFELRVKSAEAEFLVEEIDGLRGIVQENTLLPIVQPNNPELKVVRKMKVVITGYSSSPWETDDTPFITAAGTGVRDGIVANNYLKIGTKIRIPELYGDKVFIVEDRMNPTKGKYQFDIWFSSRKEALNFGAERTHIEILGK
jgi:3D (Asp-Asp-Asp) domain-containing protein